MGPRITINSMPPVFQDLFRPADYKVYYGGRGAGRSWSFAQALIARAYTENIRIACLREYQTSIADSVHQVIKSQISRMHLDNYFSITDKHIKSYTGSEFIFKGLHHNVTEIKSLEGINIAWVEEAQSVSSESWETLRPTIRDKGAEIWVSFNTGEERDPTYQQLVLKADPTWIVRKVTFKDNPHFPQRLERERLHMLHNCQEDGDLAPYNNVWLGEIRKISDAVIFKNKVRIHTFPTPDPRITRPYLGADWGFSKDPTCLIRCHLGDPQNTSDEDEFDLYVDDEVFGFGTEIDQIPRLFDTMDHGIARLWPIHADMSRPETISYIHRQGFLISAAEKWPGSVEDGIEHLKGFRRIHIHERCKHLIEESRLYSYKVDKRVDPPEVLPIVVDKYNHGWDALRYALDGFIMARGGLGLWAKLGRRA